MTSVTNPGSNGLTTCPCGRYKLYACKYSLKRKLLIIRVKAHILTRSNFKWKNVYSYTKYASTGGREITISIIIITVVINGREVIVVPNFIFLEV